MPHYDHSQPGYTILGILLLAVFTILFTIAICSHYSWVPFALLAVLILTALLFGSLRVEIRDHRIRWRLGVGVLRGEISLAQVARVEKRKSGFCTGWGIRRISGGWLYNVSGLDYVALILKDGRVVGLGTDEPDALAGTLLRHLKARPSPAGEEAP